MNGAGRLFGMHAHLLALLAIALGGPAAGADDDPSALARQAAALIAQLDSEDFAVRNDATRQLGNHGPQVLPFLIAALGDESREVRFRVRGLLEQQFEFDDLAAPLIQATGERYGATARLILRDRALVQVEEAGEMQFASKLFSFWDTDLEEFRRRVTFHVVDAQSSHEVAGIVEPLVGLKQKAVQFQEMLGRLEALNLSYDHRHSPGYVVAQTLAAGLRAHDAAQLRFAERYVQAFETLTRDLQAQGLARSEIRKEVADRANMSDGATVYLIQFLQPESPCRKTVTARIVVVPEELAQEFFRGLAAVEAKECYRCVGKVHIVDMLTTVLTSWPDAPHDGVVATLIKGVEETIGPGDKPKALVLLDALEGCRDLAKQQLDCRAGVGQQLAERLQVAAVTAPDTRAYHPVRNMHDRFLQLLALGVTPDHVAFPQPSWQLYLRGDPRAVGEEHRAAVGQYIGMVEHLMRAGVAFEQPGTQHFLALMQANVIGNRTLVTGGVQEVGRLVKAHQAARSGGETEAAIEAALGDWAEQQEDAI